MGHVEFNMPIIHPNGDVNWAAAHTNLDSIEEMSVGDINVIIILKLPFKTTRLNEMI